MNFCFTVDGVPKRLKGPVSRKQLLFVVGTYCDRPAFFGKWSNVTRWRSRLKAIWFSKKREVKSWKRVIKVQNKSSFSAAVQHTASLVLEPNGGHVCRPSFIFLNRTGMAQAEICFLQTSHLNIPPSDPTTFMGGLTGPHHRHLPSPSSPAEQHPCQGGFSTPGIYVALLHTSKTLTGDGCDMALWRILAALWVWADSQPWPMKTLHPPSTHPRGNSRALLLIEATVCFLIIFLAPWKLVVPSSFASEAW